MTLYQKHRPTALSQIVGQPAAVKTLIGLVKNMPHAVLLAGPPGTGKTTAARILAKEVGCSQMDIIEKNVANDRGIDVIREIEGTIGYKPMGGKNRAYILDEFASLTPQAAKCCLKLLEDTPVHTYFFLCTSEPQKVDKALLTRLTRINMTLLPEPSLIKLVADVAAAEEITISTLQVTQIARAAEGSARTALVLLEQAAASGFAPEVMETLAMSKIDPNLIELAQTLMFRPNWDKVIELMADVKDDQLEGLRWMLLSYCGSCMKDKSKAAKACKVIRCFGTNFFESKKPGFLAACWVAMN